MTFLIYFVCILVASFVKVPFDEYVKPIILQFDMNVTLRATLYGLCVVAIYSPALFIASMLSKSYKKRKKKKGIDCKVVVNTDGGISSTKGNTRTIKIGSFITFGTYYKDNTAEKCSVQWLVLDIEPYLDRALLISRYSLDYQKFNDNKQSNWANCSLREWLNATFLNTAFSPREQMAIAITKNHTEVSKRGVSAGEDTQDRVFLLGANDSTWYFHDMDKRICSPTGHVINQCLTINGTGQFDEKSLCRWWLRSQGDSSEHIAFVDTDGRVVETGEKADTTMAVRPALWLDLNQITY